MRTPAIITRLRHRFDGTDALAEEIGHALTIEGEVNRPVDVATTEAADLDRRLMRYREQAETLEGEIRHRMEKLRQTRIVIASLDRSVNNIREAAAMPEKEGVIR